MGDDRIIPKPEGGLVKSRPLTDEETKALRDLVSRAWSESTRRAYTWGWRVFEKWCASQGLSSMPAEATTVALFIDSQVKAEASTSAIQIQIAAVRWIHEMAKVWSPTSSPEVKLAWKSAARMLGTAAKHPKSPATLDLIEPVIEAIDRSSPRGKRDAAVILVGFYSALRRSNIAEIRRDDISRVPDGIAIRVRWSKTDQAGRGETIGIRRHGGPFCAVAALEAWLAVAPPSARVFPISPRMVATIVKRRFAAVGLNPRDFGGHSLRAGFVTSAFRAGASDVEVMGTTTHKNATHLARYRREADPVARGASSRVKPKGGTT
jgi:integrase